MIINMGGVSVGKRYASGRISGNNDSSYKKFIRSDGIEFNHGYVELRQALGFVPSYIIVIKKLSAYQYLKTEYRAKNWGTNAETPIIYGDAEEKYKLAGDARVDENGFTLPFISSYLDAEWEAYE